MSAREEAVERLRGLLAQDDLHSRDCAVNADDPGPFPCDCTVPALVAALVESEAPSSTTVHVTLADAPTDVLVWLVERPGIRFTVGEVAAGAAPEGTDQAVTVTGSALRTLLAAGYVDLDGGAWAATHSGINAVLTAKAAPS